MTILDSNAIIYLSKRLLSIDDIFIDKDDRYALSAITYMEVLGYNFDSTEEENFIKKFLSYLDILYIDEIVVNAVIKLKRKYKIKLPDAIICTTAILNDAILVTNDISLQKIENLKLRIIGI